MILRAHLTIASRPIRARGLLLYKQTKAVLKNLKQRMDKT